MSTTTAPAGARTHATPAHFLDALGNAPPDVWAIPIPADVATCPQCGAALVAGLEECTTESDGTPDDQWSWWCPNSNQEPGPCYSQPGPYITVIEFGRMCNRVFDAVLAYLRREFRVRDEDDGWEPILVWSPEHMARAECQRNDETMASLFAGIWPEDDPRVVVLALAPVPVAAAEGRAGE